MSAFASHSAGNSFEMFHRTVDSSGLVLPVVQDRQTDAASCGAHALASVINYWSPGAVTGDALYRASPPSDRKSGYSLAELVALARQRSLLASPVRLTQEDLIKELEAGRPVLIPVRVPSVYVDSHSLPADRVPVLSIAPRLVTTRAAQISELTGRGMVGHYLVVVGYEKNSFVVVEPVKGFRTISFDRLERYRRAYGDAALVMSAPQAGRPFASAAPASAVQK